MDALIAVIMGWKIDDLTAYSPTGSANARNHHGDDDWLLYYSDNIGDAMVAFLWLCERGICQISNGDGDSCDVDFSPYGLAMSDVEYKGAHVTEDTFPLAICRAVLLAVEGVENV